uniref:Beta-defensin n=1 Tax=Sarcophilus harrisii TaxID=9305 RepID=G3VWV5_SARHA
MKMFNYIFTLLFFLAFPLPARFGLDDGVMDASTCWKILGHCRKVCYKNEMQIGSCPAPKNMCCIYQPITRDD